MLIDEDELIEDKLERENVLKAEKSTKNAKNEQDRTVKSVNNKQKPAVKSGLDSRGKGGDRAPARKDGQCYFPPRNCRQRV
jgi:hypothetical protein